MLEDKKYNGILVVVILFKDFATKKNNYLPGCKYFLEHTLVNDLQNYAKDIFPLIYSIRKMGVIRSRTTGCQYIYTIKDATPEFFKQLFTLLNGKKKTTNFIHDYIVIFGHLITNEMLK